MYLIRVPASVFIPIKHVFLAKLLNVFIQNWTDSEKKASATVRRHTIDHLVWPSLLKATKNLTNISKRKETTPEPLYNHVFGRHFKNHLLTRSGYTDIIL